ncbi:uncharacterized protein LOC131062658 isoform X2 [Cryptomeria japonica]|uniref:uncharacterized protein LOC131062658 isoform X2 n=1 Tax=Cryptomeria japonica TaxID=3369 RepID=UPI0027DA02D0|nr:uncharacterized protein LOC131062658 isoform X2 [Cryptomeria japonica]
MMEGSVTARVSFAWSGWKAATRRSGTAACGRTRARAQLQRQPQPFSGTWRSIKNLLKSCRGLSVCPQDSLKQGQWVKLICGASFEDVADVRNLSLIYTLAGVDCIDCAADDSVVTAVNEGIDMAEQICMSGDAAERIPLRRPWVMISVNDDTDIHFRKAQFDPEDCPIDCSRPCERVCPADAIKFESSIHYNDVPLNSSSAKFQAGVISERCYGCGRCLPVCPYDKIRENTYVRTNAAITELLRRSDVDAIEIHTSAGHLDSFKELWNNLSNLVEQLKLIAVSLPDLGDSTIETLNAMYLIMKPFLRSYNLWQLDGRPMSGDIGKGATREAVAFAARMVENKNRPPGFLQLAGGTNSYTIEALKRIDLFQTTSIPDCAMESANITVPFEAGKQIYTDALIAGVAYGGYARKVVGRVLHKMYDSEDSNFVRLHIEQYPHFLLEALEEALALVGPMKCYDLHKE